ncbi:MAG: hypothetical protein HQ559_17805, partial [Lentisphaerae bacterium]|nr:hypothetical protein [Lentisphaerota bacterium]
MLTLVFVLALVRLVPGVFFSVLGVPAAHLSAWWLGMPCDAGAGGLVLANSRLPITITHACSGGDFFALVLALLIPFSVTALPRRRWWMTVPAAASITILANTCRIVAGWYTGVWARAALSVTYWRGVHLATGIVIFLAVLIATHTAA